MPVKFKFVDLFPSTKKHKWHEFSEDENRIIQLSLALQYLNRGNLSEHQRDTERVTDREILAQPVIFLGKNDEDSLYLLCGHLTCGNRSYQGNGRFRQYNHGCNEYNDSKWSH